MEEVTDSEQMKVIDLGLVSVHFDLFQDRMWRKTRSDHHGGCIGVDGNRNFPEGWGGSEFTYH